MSYVPGSHWLNVQRCQQKQVQIESGRAIVKGHNALVLAIHSKRQRTMQDMTRHALKVL